MWTSLHRMCTVLSPEPRPVLKNALHTPCRNNVVNSWLCHDDKWGQDRGGWRQRRCAERTGTRDTLDTLSQAVDFKEKGNFLQLKMWIFKKNMVSYTRRKHLVGQAGKLPPHELMFHPVLAQTHSHLHCAIDFLDADWQPAGFLNTQAM